jgi:hypothetical protein
MRCALPDTVGLGQLGFVLFVVHGVRVVLLCTVVALSMDCSEIRVSAVHDAGYFAGHYTLA